MTSLKPMLALIPFAIDMDLMSLKNKQKQDDCLKRYLESSVMPRKRKKQIRKKILKEYSFWVGIQKWQDELNPFK